MSAQPNKMQPRSTRKAKLTQPFWEKIKAMADAVPDEVLKDLPIDLAKNHDYYLYGVDKQE